MRPGRVFGKFGFRGSPVEALKSAWTCLYPSHAQKIALALAGFALALIPGVAQAQDPEPRPTITVSGLPTRISQPVDWTIAVTDLVATEDNSDSGGEADDPVSYTLTVTLPTGLALDVGCGVRSRVYEIIEAMSFTAPPEDESLRLHPCAVGEHTVLVSLQSKDRATVRRQVVVQVDQVGEPTGIEDGFLRQPSVAAILAARRYGDVVLVIYHVDYPDVSILPPAADAWWVDGQVGTISVTSAQAVAYSRSGWGHGILVLRHPDTITQVKLTGMPGRYASPLGVTEPVVTGASLGPDLVLALRGLQTMPQWQGQELVAGEWLGEDGIAYAEAVLPDLRSLAPDVYSSSIIALVSPTYTPVMRDDQGILPVEATSGMTGAAARATRLGEVMFRLVAAVIIALVAAAGAIKLGESGKTAVPAVALILLGATIVGWVPLALMLSLGLLSSIILGFALFGKRA